MINAPRSSQQDKKKKRKGKITQLLEYGAVYVLLFLARRIPLTMVHGISRFLGNLLYRFVKKRRTIALENLEKALGSERNEQEIRDIARKSCTSFFLTFLEIAKFQYMFKTPDTLESMRRSSPELDALLHKAKKAHDESKGCIFVTPHIGNWEFLPHVSSFAGIPLVVVVRPLDNVYLERLFFKDRTLSGQVIIPKRNALFVLQKTLQQGKSIGMLPDQSTMQGVSVDFFGRKATTTPVPAILSIMYKRPIVVVACCRKTDTTGFEGIVSDPLWPGEYMSEKEEIVRLTREMNREMEAIIRAYPEQYLWMHNRWKTYKNKRGLMA
jgi:KDO2-lipid IV(A) lauroyltransferase